MYTYPLLTSAEQLKLPRLIAQPEVIHSKFEDSTHRLWRCETEDGPMVLKVCDHDAIAKSSFWYGMNQLFGVDFPNSLGHIYKTQTLLSEHGYFTLPALVAAVPDRFITTRFLAGEDMQRSLVTDEIIIALAEHIAGLHQIQHQVWGNLYLPSYSQTRWGEQLKSTLQHMIANSNKTIPDSLTREVLANTALISESDFVPIMLDLRWDQFRILNNTPQINSLALVDLDAFAIGPRSLELVLLEYVLTAAQFNLFKNQYSLKHDWPDYSQQKSSYQLLLFLMNIMGETDVERWMQQND